MSCIPKPLIVGQSPKIKKVLEIVQKVSSVELNVLITGESGVGKELIARSLHYYSQRSDLPFVKVNCAALPGNLIESELFGYEKGAFTGADRRKTGMFEQAARGTLFLDEIGELPMLLQAKLLQVLQDRRYYRVGGQKEVEAHARVIAATNQNLEVETTNGCFRDDLYYRLSTISISIPSLRQRVEDIPFLIDYFAKKIQNNNPELKLQIPDSLMNIFMQYHWPGNVRELENYLSRLSILQNYQEVEEEILHNLKSSFNRNNYTHNEKQSEISSLHKEDNYNQKLEEFPSLKEVRDQAVKKVEREIISKVLHHTNWNRRETARLLQISYRALLYKIKEMNLKPPYN